MAQEPLLKQENRDTLFLLREYLCSTCARHVRPDQRHDLDRLLGLERHDRPHQAPRRQVRVGDSRGVVVVPPFASLLRAAPLDRLAH